MSQRVPQNGLNAGLAAIGQGHDGVSFGTEWQVSQAILYFPPYCRSSVLCPKTYTQCCLEQVVKEINVAEWACRGRSAGDNLHQAWPYQVPNAASGI